MQQYRKSATNRWVCGLMTGSDENAINLEVKCDFGNSYEQSCSHASDRLLQPIPTGVVPRKSPTFYSNFFERNLFRFYLGSRSSYIDFFSYFSSLFHMNSFVNSYTGYPRDCSEILAGIICENLLGTLSGTSKILPVIHY